jgi:hypothetical protein
MLCFECAVAKTDQRMIERGIPGSQWWSTVLAVVREMEEAAPGERWNTAYEESCDACQKSRGNLVRGNAQEQQTETR